MARKLSGTVRQALYLTTFTGAIWGAPYCSAEERHSMSQPVEFQNPYATTGKTTVAAASEEPTALSRQEKATYRNPFAGQSTTPPDTSALLPGPRSRWQRSVMPFDEPSPIRTAILSVDAIDSVHIPWERLPPVENLRHREAPRGPIANPAPAGPPDPTRFIGEPLVQPVWLATDQPTSPVDPVTFNRPIGGDPASTWNQNAANIAELASDIPPLVISDSRDSAKESLARAQEAAAAAQILDDFATVIEHCTAGLAGKPAADLATSLKRLAAWAHNRRGEILADAAQSEEAIAEFETAISLDETSSLAIHNRAVTLAQQGDSAAALQDFNRVIELNPGLAVAYRNRAELLCVLNRWEEAIADFSHVLDAMPADADLYSARAYAWQRLGELDRAEVDFERSIEIVPSDPEILTRRGNLAALRGNYARAIDDFEQAVRLDPGYGEAHRSIAWLRATCPEEGFRDPPLALDAARRAVGLSRGDEPLALEALAAAHAAAGQFDEAVRIQELAIATTTAGAAEPLRQRLAQYRARQPDVAGAKDAYPASKSRPSPKARRIGPNQSVR